MRTLAGSIEGKGNGSSFCGNRQLSCVTSWLNTLKNGWPAARFRQWAFLLQAFHASLMLMGEL